MKRNKNNGITLISLVITIIILLILAGIAISQISGENGLFNYAKKAKENTLAAQESENTTIADYEKEINKYIDSNGNSDDNNNDKKDDEKIDTTLVSNNLNKVLSTTDNTELKDAKGNKIVIPAGFKIISDSTTNNAQTVDQGIVIEDATDTATKGSQFVWIPVGTITKANGTTETITLNRYTFDEDGNETAQDNNIIETYYQELETSDYGNTVAKSIPNFKTSVALNGGYYIGRYEARTATERSSKDNSLTQITEKGSEYVYNYVTQPQAAQLSQNMYNSTKFTSDLMNSYAWDTATLFLQKCGTNSKYSRQSSLNTSLATTGTNNTETKDVQCNIYDMGSNIWEWTTETSSYSISPCSRNGSCYGAKEFYTSARGCNYISYSDIYFGFRPILYL